MSHNSHRASSVVSSLVSLLLWILILIFYALNSCLWRKVNHEGRKKTILLKGELNATAADRGRGGNGGRALFFPLLKLSDQHFSQGQVTLNLYGGKFYNKTPDKTNSSIWSRRGNKPAREGRDKKSRLSNIKTTFLTPIGTQSGYRKSKASMSRRFSPERNESLKVMIAVKTILKLKWNFFSI